jgi:uncharacterized protein YijF (DUF1287 family)
MQVKATVPILAALVLCGAATDDDAALRLVAAARAQVGVTVVYDPAYRPLSYPGGDIPLDRGVCTDVLVRAYRAIGLDLQVAVHEDMKRAWPQYPRLWGLSQPDKNIDHRRVPNLVAYFTRQGTAIPRSDDPDAYRPGDVVTWNLPSGVPHIGVVSDRRNGRIPLIIHNIGAGAAEEDILFTHRRTGHFRLIP